MSELLENESPSCVLDGVLEITAIVKIHEELRQKAVWYSGDHRTARWVADGKEVLTISCIRGLGIIGLYGGNNVSGTLRTVRHVRLVSKVVGGAVLEVVMMSHDGPIQLENNRIISKLDLKTGNKVSYVVLTVRRSFQGSLNNDSPASLTL